MTTQTDEEIYDSAEVSTGCSECDGSDFRCHHCVLDLMSLARQDENKKVMGAKFLDLLRSRATFSEKQMGLSDEELLYEKGRLQGAKDEREKQDERVREARARMRCEYVKGNHNKIAGKLRNEAAGRSYPVLFCRRRGSPLFRARIASRFP